jgi:hypothetical protein
MLVQRLSWLHRPTLPVYRNPVVRQSPNSNGHKVTGSCFRFGGSVCSQRERRAAPNPRHATTVISGRPAPVESPGQASSCPYLRSRPQGQYVVQVGAAESPGRLLPVGGFCARIQGPGLERRPEPDIAGTDIDSNLDSAWAGPKSGLQPDVVRTFRLLDLTGWCRCRSGPVSKLNCSPLPCRARARPAPAPRSKPILKRTEGA